MMDANQFENDGQLAETIRAEEGDGHLPCPRTEAKRESGKKKTKKGVRR
jgi:hypothetical protein